MVKRRIKTFAYDTLKLGKSLWIFFFFSGFDLVFFSKLLRPSLKTMITKDKHTLTKPNLTKYYFPHLKVSVHTPDATHWKF